MNMRSYSRLLAILGLCAVMACAGTTLAPTKASADLLGGALEGALIGGLVGGGEGAIDGAIIGGVIGGVSQHKRQSRRWRRQRNYVRGYRRGYRHGYTGRDAPRCRDVGGYEAYRRRTGRVCRLD